ncbi:HNH endonuclease [Candidatus Bathyarchaeota archaeon]|nr:MAG: HNH endonuclease [Candidatus Bathyarchaeota archaeon]
MPTRADFQRVLNSIFNQAESKGLKFVDVTAGDLHRKVGGYPGPNHRMPLCCSVMKQNMQEGDIILYQPPSGQGASLRIRYKLPRKAP